MWPGQVVTTISPAGRFWEAEDQTAQRVCGRIPVVRSAAYRSIFG
jgi:hypothetical protein